MEDTDAKCGGSPKKIYSATRVRGGKSISAFVSQRKKARLPPFALSSYVVCNTARFSAQQIAFHRN
jgi:hypothetical protein